MAHRAKDDDMEEEEPTLAQPEVVTKYKDAAEIANLALAAVVKECTPGKKIIDACRVGDKVIEDKLAASYKSLKEKGMAFPTSISVNNIVGHYSPLGDDTAVLNDGDVAKIDLGVQIDGFISLVAHTTIVCEPSTVSSPQAVTGRKADVICAAHYASEAAIRLIKPGKKNTDVTNIIAKVAEQFKCQPVEGVLSHQMKRFVIDGNQTIINKATQDQKVDEFEFQDGEVYAVDIVMSTGEGKASEKETRPTIYKRAIDQNYQLKMQASRYVYTDIMHRFPALPFTIRSLDEKRGKLGITELVKHDLVYPFPVLYEKQGEFVAHFKFTVLVLPSGTLKLNSHPLPFVTSEHKIVDDEVNKLLRAGTGRSKPKAKKAKATTATTTEAKPTGDAMDTSK